MAQDTPLAGRGILYFTSKIARPDVINEQQYLNWYDNKHIMDMLETSAVKTALRYRAVDPSADKPFLTMYPVDDIAFTQTDEFKNISLHSDLLPDGMSAYDIAEFDVRYYKLAQVYDQTKKGPAQTHSILIQQFELNSDGSPEEFDRWYREENLKRLMQVEGFLRTTLFELAYARTCTPSGALNRPEAEEKESLRPPRWLAIQEYAVHLDIKKISEATDDEWTKMVSSTSESKGTEATVYRLAFAGRKQDWFHDT